MRCIAFGGIVGAAVLVGACGVSGGNGGTTAATSTGADGTGGSGTGGGESSGSGGSTAACPIDEAGREQAEGLIAAAMVDADWVSKNSEGFGVGAPRAFGASVPFTKESAYFMAPVTEECMGGKVFDVLCEPLMPDDPDLTWSRCSQLSCDLAGALQAKVWIDPMPFSAALATGEGMVEVSLFDHKASFREIQMTFLAITWATEIGIAVEKGKVIESSVHGTTIIAPMGIDVLVIEQEILGLAASRLKIMLTNETSPLLAGEGTVDETSVLRVESGGVQWVGPCEK